MNDGGSAFPAIIPLIHNPEQGKDYPDFTEEGMSLRDWFAGHAPIDSSMANAWASSEERIVIYRICATYAYEWADAMLAERAKGGAK